MKLHNRASKSTLICVVLRLRRPMTFPSISVAQAGRIVVSSRRSVITGHKYADYDRGRQSGKREAQTY
jgi:hypothetical protein